MLKKIQFTSLIVLIPVFAFADVFMTELADPQNQGSSSSGNGNIRYVELHNNGDSAVDLSSGWSLQRWTNGGSDPQTAVALTGTISAGGFYIVCNGADDFLALYGLACDQDIGTGGAADSNGDDNIALLDASGIVDMFGVAGEDGSGTGHEFEDGRAERAESNTAASATWDASGWNIDNDSGGGDGNQYAPEGFDPGAWIGASSGGGDPLTCTTSNVCTEGYEPSDGWANNTCDTWADGCTMDHCCQEIVDTCTTSGVCGDGNLLGGWENNPCDTWTDGCTADVCCEPIAPNYILITEIADPNQSGTPPRFVELYNTGDTDVDLSSGWALKRWTNGGSNPQSPVNLTGTIVAGGFYIVCNGGDDFNATYGETCDQDIGTGGAADSNGDDQIGLYNGAALVDFFGVVGQDGTGTWHEFEDGRVERIANQTSGCTDTAGCESHWIVDGDNGNGDGAQSAPDGYDPGAWIGDSSVATCDDSAACNNGEAGDCEYVNIGWGNLGGPNPITSDAGSASENIYGQVWVDGVSGSSDPASGIVAELGYGADGSSPDDSWTWGSASLNSAFDNSNSNNDEFMGQLTIADAGTYSYSYRYSYNSSCWYYASEVGSATVNALTTYPVTFNVDMYYQEVDSVNGIRIFGLSSWSSDDAITMTDDDGDGVYSATVDLTAGDYQYKYRNGWTYEDVDNLSCASNDGSYWNRDLSVSGDASLDTDCFGSCDACALPINITFNVDMANELVADDGVTLNVADGYHDMSDDDGDGVYSVTVSLQQNTHYTFKYLNGMGGWEPGLTDCGEGTYFDRILDTGTEDMNLDTVCFGTCVACVEQDPGTVLSAGDIIITEIHYNPASSQGGDADFEFGEIYNTTDADILLNGCSFGDSGSAADLTGATISAGGYLVVASNGASYPDLTNVLDNGGYFGLGNSGKTLQVLDSENNVINEVTYDDGGDWPSDPDGDGPSLELSDLSLDNTLASSWQASAGVGGTPGVANSDGPCNDTDGDGLCDADDADDDNDGVLDADDCAPLDASASVVDDCNVCGGDGSTCTPTACDLGDVTDDGVTNVLDVVRIVGYILQDPNTSEFSLDCADWNNDAVVNVLDVVAIVDYILNGTARSADATSATLIRSGNSLSVQADGWIGAVQLTLTHGEGFSIDLSDDAFMSDYHTAGNVTRLMVISPSSDQLFTANGSFTIEKMIVANSQEMIQVSQVSEFGLSAAYPNPFNPITTVELAIVQDGIAKVNVYDLSGRLVTEIMNGYLSAGIHAFTWTASDMPSGMYLIRADMAHEGSSMQKVILLK